jgi:hypothetical protein
MHTTKLAAYALHINICDSITKPQSQIRSVSSLKYRYEDWHAYEKLSKDGHKKHLCACAKKPFLIVVRLLSSSLKCNEREVIRYIPFEIGRVA